MFRIVIISALIALVSGCTTPSFYSNDALNAESTLRTVTATRVDSQNREFTVFKLGDGSYAIVPSYNQYRTELDQLNASLILNKEQREDLISVCKQISSAYGNESKGKTTVIDYRIRMKESEVVGLTSSAAADRGWGMEINTKTRVTEQQRIVFRLQYAQSKGVGLGEGKNIKYSFGGYVDDITVEDLRALVADLEK